MMLRQRSIASFEHMDGFGCLEVNDPTIDLITLSFKDQEADHLLAMGMFVVTELCHFTERREKNSSLWIK